MGNNKFFIGLRQKNDCKSKQRLLMLLGFWIFGIGILTLRSLYKWNNAIPFTEDGMWTGQLIENGLLKTLYCVTESYFVFGDIIPTWIAKEINLLFWGYNLSYLPYIQLMIANGIYAAFALFPFLVFKKHELCDQLKYMLWLGILLLPFGNCAYEILGVINNLGQMWYIVVLAALYWEINCIRDRETIVHIISNILIFIGCNTNPLAYFLVFFVTIYLFLEEIRSKTSLWNIIKRHKYYFVLLSSLFVTALLIIRKSMIGQRMLVGEGTVGWKNLIEYLARSILFPWIYNIYTELNDVIAVVSLLLIVVLFYWMYKVADVTKSKKYSYWIAGTIFWIVMEFFMRPGLTKEILNNYTTTYPDRYYYVSNILSITCLCFVCNAGYEMQIPSKKKLIKAIHMVTPMTILPFIYLIGGNSIFEFNTTPYYTIASNLSTWSYRVINSSIIEGSNNHRIDLTVWTPFSMIVPDEYYRATIFNVRNASTIEYDDIILATDFSDTNWQNGILKSDDHVVLYEKTETNRTKLQNGNRFFTSDGSELFIDNVNIDESYYVVTYRIVDSDNIPDIKEIFIKKNL